MKDSTPEPFLLLEPDAAPRLEAVPPITPVVEPLSRAWSPALIGAATLGLGIPVLWGAWLVGALFDRWNALGWAGLIVLLIGLSLIGLGIGRELHGLAALRRVDQLRDEFASGETGRIQRAARRWLEKLPQHSGILPALATADTPEAVLHSCVRGRGKPSGRRRMCSDGPPLFRASRSSRRPLRLRWTFWPLAGAVCG
jgi:putative membrane protein